MKRDTAIRNTLTIAARLRSWSGVICTPEASQEALRVRRAWLFGSTAKGAPDPRDIDILLDAEPVGPRRRCVQSLAKIPGVRLGARVDHDIRRSIGLIGALDCTDVALRSLRSGMKMVRFHWFHVDGSLGDIARTKVMIYPRVDPRLRA